MTASDENKVRQIVAQILSSSQYKVSPGFFHEHTGTDSAKIPFKNLDFAPNQFCVAATSTGTVAVNILGAKGANFNATLTGLFLIANDATAGNITVKNNGNQVAVIAKGTTSGALTGATSITNTSYLKGNSCTLVSSSAGNATIFLTFTV